MSEERKDLKPQTKTFVLAGVCLAVLFTHRAPAAELPDARVKRMIAGVIFEVSTNHSPDGVWLPWNSYSNYVGAANPGEFDAEHEKIDLPFNRKFMHYCNIESTEKKITLLLKRLDFSTVKNVLGLKDGDKNNCVQHIKEDKYFDAPYFKSALSGYLLVLSICVVLCIAAVLMNGYAFLIVILFATIFYWPWGALFTKINRLCRRI